MGGRAADPRAGLGARRRPQPRRRAQGVRRLPAHRERARDRRVAAGQEDRGPVPGGGEAAQALDRYAYGPPPVRFANEDVDQARAAGVLIEFDGPGRPIIVDRPLYRELVKTAIKRTHDELQAKVDAAAKDKQTSRASKGASDPVTVAKRERDAQLRELTARRTAPTSTSATRWSTAWPPSTRPTSPSRGSSSTRCWAPTTTTRRTPRAGSEWPRSPPTASASSWTSCAPT